ncbi:transmembrane protein 271 [Ornithorhynchus anatinus]|uniref:transmembrane protein 271 n=1 Tax=Ornithorhynchus anatinus TaxID=9258 RepID=UPI0010A87228|nr:transmembrane protein 271 [Ornithorhynchus anatinus]
MKWSVRGACAALSSCLLLACALSAAAVGLKCFSLGSELRGEPFRLGTAAGAFYSGLLLAAGLSLLGSALLCCRPGDEAGGAAGGAAGGPAGTPAAGAAGAAGPAGGAEAREGGGPAPASQNFLLLGVLVFMLGVLSAFAGAVIDGDTVSLVERKYSHYCLQQQQRGPAAGGQEGQLGPAQVPAPARPRGSSLDSSTSAKCQKLKDYQRGLVISTVFNSLECLLGLVNLLLVKNYKSSQARRGRRGRRRGGRAGRAGGCGGGGRTGGGGAGGGGRGPPHAHPYPPRQRRLQRARRAGRRLQPRRSDGSIFSPDEADFSPPGGGDFPARHSVSYINVGVFHVLDEAGVEVQCGGHPSVELPGYSPSDPELDASYPYCSPPPGERPPPYEEIYPREPGGAVL